MNLSLTHRGRPAARQAEVLGYVRQKTTSDGVAPSYGMICHDLGISSRGEVRRIVSRLEDLGKLRRVGAGRVRRIRLS